MNKAELNHRARVNLVERFESSNDKVLYAPRWMSTPPSLRSIQKIIDEREYNIEAVLHNFPMEQGMGWVIVLMKPGGKCAQY